MRFIDFLVLLLLFALLFVGVYFLWLNLPTELIEFEEYHAEISEEFPIESNQFYAKMRYVDRKITYSLSNSCSEKKKKDFEEATEYIEDETILTFHQTSVDPEIEVSCSNIAPEPTEENHFVAGEGGPSVIINASLYSVILSGKIALYRAETCPTPQIATHELLHALGFNHNSNQSSLMYPITDCEQTLDQQIIDEINLLYEQPPEPDLLINTIIANKSGRYLNFKTSIANYGLKDIKTSTLNLIVENSIVRSFPIGNLEIGAKRTLEVTNLKIPKNTEKVTLKIISPQPEITQENNEATIKLIDLN
jgi:hypothetical protein